MLRVNSCVASWALVRVSCAVGWLLQLATRMGLIMTSFHGHMSEYDSSVEEWTAYTERLDSYLIANDVTSEDKKQAILLSVCGPSTYRLIWNLVAPQLPKSKSFADLVKLVKEHYHAVKRLHRDAVRRALEQLGGEVDLRHGFVRLVENLPFVARADGGLQHREERNQVRQPLAGWSTCNMEREMGKGGREKKTDRQTDAQVARTTRLVAATELLQRL